MQDIYVTDHVPSAKKHLTNSEEEDEEFYAYQKSLEEYDNEPETKVFTSRRAKYVKGSLMQKIMDPFAESYRDEEGTIIYTLEEKELAHFNHEDESHMRSMYEKAKSNQEVWDVDTEDEEAWRIAMI